MKENLNLFWNFIEKKERGRKPDKGKTKEKKLASTNSSIFSQIAKSPLLSAKISLQRVKSQKERVDHGQYNQTVSNTISNIMTTKINTNALKKTNEYKPTMRKMLKLPEDSGIKN